MLATVVVGHFGHGREQLGDGVETRFGHRQRRQGERTAQAIDVEHRTEAGEDPVVEQLMQAVEQFGAAAVQFLGQGLPRVTHQRQAQLQPIDQATVEVIHRYGLRRGRRNVRRIA
ncbi:hypothetical protein D3C84_956350 [compost metagenome]